MSPDSRHPAYERRWKILGALASSLIIIGLDDTVLNVALPTLQAHFHASASTLEWIVDAHLLTFAGLLLTMGTRGDRFCRKRAPQLGLVVFGGALIMPATRSIITNVFPRDERGKAIGARAGMAAAGIGYAVAA